MSKAVRNMIIRDPSKYHLLATEMKLAVIQAGKDTVNILGAQASKEMKRILEENLPHGIILPQTV